MFKEAIEVAHRNFGGESPHSLDVMNQLGISYYAAKKYAEAESIFKQKIDIIDDKFGGDNDTYGKAVDDLGIFYQKINRNYDAKQCYEKSISILDKTGDYYLNSNIQHRLKEVT